MDGKRQIDFFLIVISIFISAFYDSCFYSVFGLIYLLVTIKELTIKIIIYILYSDLDFCNEIFFHYFTISWVALAFYTAHPACVTTAPSHPN